MNKNAPEQNREKKRPVRYLLISVCERDIVTEFLGTYQEAFSQMLSELKEEFCKGNDPDDWEAYAHLPHYRRIPWSPRITPLHRLDAAGRTSILRKRNWRGPSQSCL